MPQSKAKDNSKCSGIAVEATTSATSPASTDTKPPTADYEMRPKASELVLPRFDFERHHPYTPNASFSSAELFDELLRDEATMTIEELDKKYKFYKEGPAKPVPAHRAMAILMEEMGSI
ncbi:unnamed protein product [Clonostachys byssicola]|uniref:Uncharacterized protein n=1 Tax=Clonostachys byssicola TaxID=160290 RepID=A0A9N9TVU6_9HYPO|nr:unnamed protein product [Clonostachys byssicola]